MPSGPAATVLVLEGNAALRELFEQALRDAGHHVLCTPDPHEALEVARRIRVDVVIVGEPSPAFSRSTIHEIRELQPLVEIVDVAESGDQLGELTGATRLSSPISLDELGERIGRGRDQSPLLRHAGG